MKYVIRAFPKPFNPLDRPLYLDADRNHVHLDDADKVERALMPAVFLLNTDEVRYEMVELAVAERIEEKFK